MPQLLADQVISVVPETPVEFGPGNGQGCVRCRQTESGLGKGLQEGGRVYRPSEQVVVAALRSQRRQDNATYHVIASTRDNRGPERRQQRLQAGDVSRIDITTEQVSSGVCV